MTKFRETGLPTHYINAVEAYKDHDGIIRVTLGTGCDGRATPLLCGAMNHRTFVDLIKALDALCDDPTEVSIEAVSAQSTGQLL